MYKYIILSFGFAEDNYVSLIIISRYDDLEFETKDDIIKNISYFFLKAYKEHYRIGCVVNACCKQAMNNGGRFCSECGNNLKTIGLVYKDNFYNYIISLPSVTADDVGISFDELEWNIFTDHEVICSITKENSVFIYEAEKVIVSILEDELV